MDSKWNMYAKQADFAELAKRYGVDQVVTRILVNRDIPEEEMGQYLHPSLDQLHDPHQLKDVERAADLILASIQKEEKLRIIGDYDIDGISSTYILHQALLRVGANADYAIPHRIEDGYGMNPSMVDKAKEAGVTTIVTCDNGIAAREACERAKSYGMTVIVTDHHEIPYEEREGERHEVLPLADAIVNPHQRECTYPFPDICGAVVAWKLVFVLYEKAGISMEEAYAFLENAAFATIGDIMPLKNENRAIVKLGLQALAHTQNPGMNALMERLGIDRSRLSTYHVGFQLGPCFNASGRLDTAVDAIELLEEQNPQRALARAAELQNMNEERKAMTKEGDEKALQILQQQGLEQDDVLIVYVPGLHESLAGIVAGHLKEKYYRPTFVLTDASDGGLKGSGRSIPAYSMYEKLHQCQEFLTKYGGHPMAAGISLDRESLEPFRQKMNALAELSTEDKTPVVHIDVPMPLGYVTEDLVHELDLLEPFGNGNEKPIFAEKNVSVRKIAYLGREKQYLKFFFALANGGEMQGLYFRGSQELEQALRQKYGDDAWEAALQGQQSGISLTITYYPQMNRFRGTTSLQAMITGYKA